MKQILYRLSQVLTGLVLTAGVVTILGSVASAQTQESGSVGLEGKVNSAPPTQGATITFPRDGATITDMPVTVTGLCPTGLLVKIFKNNVFAGSTQCVNGSFSIQIDLFSGRNELVARVYDDLDQAGPDSNIVIVTRPVATTAGRTLVSLTSPFAKRGANPGQTLTWPIVITGGTGPYAISVDWGDGSPPDIISQEFAGTFNISHVYKSAGVYNVIIRATDKDGNVAFLQLVGVANGAVQQAGGAGAEAKNGDGSGGAVRTKVLWQPAAFAFPFMFLSFWLGKRYELFVLRKRLERREEVS